MPDSFIPGPTPSGYQRTTGGQFRWRVPSVQELQTYFTQYEILDLLGRGGMGAVFRAHQKSLDRLVAIKVLPLEEAEDSHNFIERFRNEARTMARLDHPGIVHVHDFGETDSGLLYFVMEFIEGSDVQQLLFAQGALTPAYALPITQHVCDALAYAHSQGVIHRDIKPANIMLTKEGRVKVADFGLARLDDPGQPGLTQTGMAMGTPDYVAPEALAPGGVVDSRADLYAIGVMLCHMLTGEVPRGMFELPSQRNAALDPRIDGVITKAMRQRPEERYQTAAALRADLDAILAQPQAAKVTVTERPKAEPAPVTSTEQESLPAGRRLPFHWSVLAGVGVVVAAGAAFLMLSKSRRPDAGDVPKAVAAAQSSVVEAPPLSGGPALNSTQWLPFTYPGDFGKIDGGVEVLKDGGFVVQRSFGKRLRTSWTHQDLAVRARISLPADGVGIIGLRSDLNKAVVRAVVRPDRIEIVSEVREDGDATDQTILQSFAGLSGPFYEKQGAEMVFAVLGSEYHLWLGERFLGSVTHTTISGGKVLFDGVNATFREMQWQVIGDTSSPVAPAPPALKAVDITGVWPRPGISSQCVLYPDGKIILINRDGQEDRSPNGILTWSGWRWRIEADKALLSSANGALQEEWTLTQPGVVAIKNVVRGSSATSTRSSTVIPTIRPAPPPIVASKPAPQMATPSQAASPSPILKVQIPVELTALQTEYAIAIAERVNQAHYTAFAQLNTGFLAAVDRAVASRQFPADASLADKKAIASKQSLPPDTDATPEALKALRATYRAKASEIDETRTTAHLSLLTPYVTKLRELEAKLGRDGRTADAATVKAYRDALSENPLALPEAAKP